MKETLSGWVIVAMPHFASKQNSIQGSSFRTKRTDCIKDFIKDFIKGSGSDWKYWKRNFNFSCVRSKQQVIAIFNHQNNKK